MAAHQKSPTVGTPPQRPPMVVSDRSGRIPTPAPSTLWLLVSSQSFPTRLAPDVRTDPGRFGSNPLCCAPEVFQSVHLRAVTTLVHRRSRHVFHHPFRVSPDSTRNHDIPTTATSSVEPAPVHQSREIRDLPRLMVGLFEFYWSAQPFYPSRLVPDTLRCASTWSVRFRLSTRTARSPPDPKQQALLCLLVMCADRTEVGAAVELIRRAEATYRLRRAEEALARCDM